MYEVADQFVQGDFPHLIEDVCHKILKVFHIQFLWPWLLTLLHYGENSETEVNTWQDPHFTYRTKLMKLASHLLYIKNDMKYCFFVCFVFFN